MAFDEAGLHDVITPHTAKLLHYVTNDNANCVEADGYFDKSKVNKGDTIIAVLDCDGTPELEFYVVTIGKFIQDAVSESNNVTIASMNKLPRRKPHGVNTP